MKALAILIFSLIVGIPILSAEGKPLDQWIQLFLEKNQSVQREKLNYRSSVELENEARKRLFPDIKLTGTATRQEQPTVLTGGLDISPENIYGVFLEVEQPIYLGGKIWRGLEFREIQRALAFENYFKVKQDELRVFLQALTQWQSQKDLILILKESQKRQEDTFKLTKRKRRRGAVQDFELAQAEAEWLSYQPRIESSEIQVTELENQVRRMLELDSNEVVEVMWPESPKTILNSEKALRLALGQRPEAQISKIQIQRANNEKWIELGDHLPSLAVQGKYGYQAINSADLGQENTKAHSVSLALTIPLFSGFSSFNIRRAYNYQISSAQKDKANFIKNLRIQVENSVTRIQRLEEVVKKSNLWAQKSKQALDKALRIYRMGVVPNASIVQLQSSRERAAVNEIESQGQFRRALIDYHFTVGNDLEEIYTGQIKHQIKN